MNKKSVTRITDEDWKTIWKPLLYNREGKLSLRKIENEMHDLIFIYNQVSYVYCEITGNRLSKPTYYADTILSEYNREIEEAYQRGYDDAKKELGITPSQDNV